MTSIPNSPRSEDSEPFDVVLGSYEQYLRTIDEELDRRVDESDAANAHLDHLPVRTFAPGPEFEQRGVIENEPSVDQVFFYVYYYQSSFESFDT